MIPCDKCPAKTDPKKSHCCGIIPFPLKFLEEHKKFFQESGELKDDGNQSIILTPDLICVFMNRKTQMCAIYDERPEVCRLYGTIEKLPCLYFKRSGNPRSPASQKIIKRQLNAMVDRAVKRGEAMI